MRGKTLTRRILSLFFAAALLLVSSNFYARRAPALLQPNISINGFFSTDRVQRGTTLQAALVMDIPDGFHVNSSRPLSSFSVPTTVKIEAPRGMRVSAVSFPRAVVRKLSFSNDQLAVYEGRAVMRFNIIVPANREMGVMELRARIRYQSCNDEVCFPPVTREVTMPIAVVGANEAVKRINGNLFGGRRRR